ncbi:MAG TPA: TIGR03915 family putative DNA repair protein [Spirochaetota bacterium]|mgnify:CR=1 FL=1|nr:TIGR03915 family putative DNA repair protein [Spirochaetota bacterium]
MLVYVYNGGFEGFLTVIYDCIKDNVVPENICPYEKVENNLFAEFITINPDQYKAQKVIERIKVKFSYDAVKNIFFAYLSDEPDIELNILLYVRDLFLSKRDVGKNYANKNSLKIRKIILNVKNEAHRFLGILRFAETKDGIYYASMEPDNNIIYIITNHFVKRFANQKFIICDEKRNIAAFYDLKNVEYVSIESISDLEQNYSEEEKNYQTLWKTYFKKIAIEERNNTKLQKQFIPLKYRKYLTEMKDYN